MPEPAGTRLAPPWSSGVLIWTGELFQLNIEAQRFLDRFGLNFSSEV